MLLISQYKFQNIIEKRKNYKSIHQPIYIFYFNIKLFFHLQNNLYKKISVNDFFES